MRRGAARCDARASCGTVCSAMGERKDGARMAHGRCGMATKGSRGTEHDSRRAGRFLAGLVARILWLEPLVGASVWWRGQMSMQQPRMRDLEPEAEAGMIGAAEASTHETRDMAPSATPQPEMPAEVPSTADAPSGQSD